MNETVECWRATACLWLRQFTLRLLWLLLAGSGGEKVPCPRLASAAAERHRPPHMAQPFCPVSPLASLCHRGVTSNVEASKETRAGELLARVSAWDSRDKCCCHAKMEVENGHEWCETRRYIGVTVETVVFALLKCLFTL